MITKTIAKLNAGSGALLPYGFVEVRGAKHDAKILDGNLISACAGEITSATTDASSRGLAEEHFAFVINSCPTAAAESVDGTYFSTRTAGNNVKCISTNEPATGIAPSSFVFVEPEFAMVASVDGSTCSGQIIALSTSVTSFINGVTMGTGLYVKWDPSAPVATYMANQQLTATRYTLVRISDITRASTTIGVE